MEAFRRTPVQHNDDGGAAGVRLGGEMARRLKLSDQAVGELRGRIVRGEWLPGERLPIEPELGESLGVSRTVVRDALRTLTTLGLVEVRQGIGTIVAQPSDDALRDALIVQLQRSNLRMGEVVAGRAMIESALAAEAAIAGSTEDWERMRAVLESFRAAVDAADWTSAHEEHLQFHLGIFRALHRPGLDLMLRPLQRVIVMSSLPPTIDEVRFWEVESHYVLLEALESGDAAAARQASLDHFAYIATPEYAGFSRMLFRDVEAHETFPGLGSIG